MSRICVFLVGFLSIYPVVFGADIVDQQAPVTLTQDAATATLDNGIVSITVKKINANVDSLRYRGMELLGHGGGYWNIYGEIPNQAKTQEKPTPSEFIVSHDPAANGGALGEMTLRFPYQGQPKAEPLDIEIRYTLRRGDSGVYGWTIARHQPQYPAFNIEVNTVCLKLNPDIFDFLSVDKDRQKEMVSPADWVKGTQLNMLEVRRINTGPHAGEVEHKYDYRAMFSKTPAYGWSSTTKNVGVWIVNPSIEYINGSPTKEELTGHIDVKAALPADPTLLFVWHGSHYGGLNIAIEAGEAWEKVVGPFLIYCNHADGHEALWQDALQRASAEQKAWPYEWADAPGYAHADQRGSASGRIVAHDPQDASATAAGAWVGLAAPSYTAKFDDRTNAPVTINWETDGKHYQYWTHADAAGNFTIPNARPGDYTLYAFNDGILGEFSRANVHVDAGKVTDLGEMNWIPIRFGQQLWQIGIANRSAEEFRHGDHYWQWGLYQLYPQEFPNGVDFVIGKSDPRVDWNYCQCPIPGPITGWKGTTWRIRFNVDHLSQGTATLRLAICGARGGPVDASVNGKSAGTTGPLPETGAMHRDAIRSTEIERDIKFDASQLKIGENVIELTKEAKQWTDGVLYDCVRLEVDQNAAFKQ